MVLPRGLPFSVALSFTGRALCTSVSRPGVNCTSRRRWDSLLAGGPLLLVVSKKSPVGFRSKNAYPRRGQADFRLDRRSVRSVGRATEVGDVHRGLITRCGWWTAFYCAVLSSLDIYRRLGAVLSRCNRIRSVSPFHLLRRA